jgi:hypothetical protein
MIPQPLRSRIVPILILAGLAWGLTAGAGPGPTPPPAARAQAGPASFALDPKSGPPGTPVVLKGSSLGGVTKVLFSPDVEAAFTVVDDQTVTTAVPNGAMTGPIQAVTAAGVLTSTEPFQVATP